MTVQTTKDVTVTIDIQHSSPAIGLTNGLLLVAGDQEKYEEYDGFDAVNEDYDEGSNVSQIAETYFAQDNAPDLLAILTYQSGDIDNPDAKLASPSNVSVQSDSGGATVQSKEQSNTKIPGIVKAVKDYFYGNWEFLFMSKFNKDDALALAKFIDEEDFHLFFPEVTSLDDVAAFKEFKRTLPNVEKDTENHIVAAMIGAGGPQEVGSLNWKFLHDLKNVDINYTNAVEVANIVNAGAFCYTAKNQTPALSSDRNAAGYYIDFFHGKDFSKTLIENNLQTLLFTNSKVPYGSAGVTLVLNNLKSSLATLYSMGIIATDKNDQAAYTVDSQAFADVKETDIFKRIYKGLKFTYTASNGIDNIDVAGGVKQY